MAYSYEQILAVDPSNPANVARAASITIFAPGDAAKTPLTLTDTNGSPLANPLTVNANGFGPAFIHATLDRVAWEGGGFTGFLTSYEGMREEATAARVAAESANAEAQAAKEEVVTAAQAPTDAAVDAGIARADVPAIVATVIASDPTVTTAAAALAQSDEGLLRSDAAQVPQITETDEHLFLGVDSLRRFTDLAIRKSDGQYDDAVMARWAVRLAPLLTGVQAEFPTYADGARYSRTSDVLPANADTTRLAGWGSSTMDGLVSRLTTTAAGFGATYYNGGRSGQRMQVILARLGSRPAHVTGTIAADTSETTVTVPEFPPLSFVSFKGWLVLPDGTEIYGTLRGPDASTVVFSRAVAGTSVAVTGAEFIPEDGHANRDAVTILNIGKNNFTGGDNTMDEQIIAATDEAFDWLAPLNKKTVVLGHFANGSFNTGAPTESYNQVVNVNAAHKKRYGPLFIDLSAYVTGSQIWTDTGITPTQEDLDMQARGVKPTSLSLDDGHLNSAGLDAVNTHLIQPHLAGLGWFS